MKRELKDELEVPGTVLSWEFKHLNKANLIKKAKKIIRYWESRGWNTPNEVPECPSKEEFRRIMKQLGADVRF